MNKVDHHSVINTSLKHRQNPSKMSRKYDNSYFTNVFLKQILWVI